MYDEPLGAFGTFQCNKTGTILTLKWKDLLNFIYNTYYVVLFAADMMVLSWYGTYVGFSSVHIACDFADPLLSLNKDDQDAYNHTTTKQMLGCTDQSEVKDGQEKSYVFQTVRCASGQAVPV